MSRDVFSILMVCCLRDHVNWKKVPKNGTLTCLTPPHEFGQNGHFLPKYICGRIGNKKSTPPPPQTCYTRREGRIWSHGTIQRFRLIRPESDPLSLPFHPPFCSFWRPGLQPRMIQIYIQHGTVYLYILWSPNPPPPKKKKKKVYFK